VVAKKLFWTWAEDLLTVVEAVDIILWPVAMYFKKSDVEAMEDGSIVVFL